ncbi:MAG: MarR family winged helix-turn-helix transcriptional regulator [bacterium]|nr:MarR family winged helix-turn-helix transcriptional regulator [bacterium]
MKPYEIGKEFHFISNTMKRNIDAKVAEFGLTSVQSRVLHFIEKKGQNDTPVYQKDIEGMFDVRRSTVTSILQLLEKNGYINRESVPSDARLKQLKLTAKGREATVVVGKIILEEEENILKDVTQEERELFFGIIQRISEAVRNS